MAEEIVKQSEVDELVKIACNKLQQQMLEQKQGKSKTKLILFIGQELVAFKEGSLYLYLKKKLEEEKKELFSQIEFFDDEELVRIKKRSEYIGFLKDFYDKKNPFSPILEKIAAMPFSDIVSLIPSSKFNDSFNKSSINYGYYSKGQFNVIENTYDNGDPIDFNNADWKSNLEKKRFIFYLTGDVNNNEIIDDFDSFFSFISSFLKENVLPDFITNKIKDENAFMLFLGIPFYKWHMQLILKLMKDKKGGNSEWYLQRTANEKYTYIENRFELTFLNIQPVDFLEKMYLECAKRNILINKIEAPPKPVGFLSYSGNILEIVDIQKALETKGIELIIDESHGFISQEIKQFIETSLARATFVIFLVSAKSLASYWVHYEFERAIELGKNIYPIVVDKTYRTTIIDEIDIIIKEKIQKEFQSKRVSDINIGKLNTFEKAMEQKAYFDKRIFGRLSIEGNSEEDESKNNAAIDKLVRSIDEDFKKDNDEEK